MAFEGPGRVRTLLLGYLLGGLAQLPQHQAVVLLQLLLVQVLQVLVGREDKSEIVQAENGLDDAVHVAGVAQIVQPRLGHFRRHLLLPLLVILTLKRLLTSLIVVVHIIDSAPMTAVHDLSAEAGQTQTTLLHALLAVAKYLLLLLLS